MEDPLVQDAAQEAAAAATEARFTMNKVTTWTSIVNLFWGVLICVCGFAGFIIVQTHWSFNLEGQSIPLPLKTEYSNTNMCTGPAKSCSDNVGQLDHCGWWSCAVVIPYGCRGCEVREPRQCHAVLAFGLANITLHYLRDNDYTGFPPRGRRIPCNGC
mmetsp:Transcript_45683/g.107783  ORF Transcript_45683/g.107783 Transcript_45683/m.107783 type:complete len:158 (-) Transcript_45683:235-708(-)